MPDRRRRTDFRLPRPERPAPLMRERSSSSQEPSGSSGSSGSSGGGSQDDNPFAPPPADRPDQPWRPRRPHASGGQGGRHGTEGSDENGNGSGSSADRPAWGSQWSDRQPGRGGGGFGGRPGGNGSGGPGGKNGNDRGGPGGLRWDPRDPAQRRARYAVLGGMWAFFFALFDFPEIALLLGSLATYWAISALRAPAKDASGGDGTGTPGAASVPGSGSVSASAPASASAGEGGAGAPGRSVAGRQQTTAAVSGLVTALLALLIVATTFTVQLVYRDYYTCVNDALTKSGALACNDQLPKPLEPFFGVKE
ncbi:hypothetical protein B1H20_22340 [Streptomyces violaceoruber]|uniref:Integral membrane protein n=1 Tax=Streptomyces violaceoruber TaxID=1935 RepID=A0A1V0UFD3_STRVN|nr:MULTISPECIES: hypothetical protein [Streptomyces]ARF63816.1 hypothetical protein B1H20_22340 [Streptomyces violaceoruber]